MKVKTKALINTTVILGTLDKLFYFIEQGIFLGLKSYSILISVFFVFFVYMYLVSGQSFRFVSTTYDYVLEYFYPNTSLFKSSVLGVSTQRQFPYKTNILPYPYITAKSAVVIDTKGNEILFEKDKTLLLPPASTTKLVTALVAKDIYTDDQRVKIPTICTEIDTTKAGFIPGKEYAVSELLESMLIASAGDAACTLATSIVPYETFMSLMRAKLSYIGVTDTKLSNPIGLDGVNGDHVSTSNDLYYITKEFMNNTYFREIVSTKNIKVEGQDIQNTNKLLWEIPNSIGVKTGTTAEAGQVLVFAYKEGKKEIISVVMGSQDRFTDTKALLEWVLRSYSWE